MEATKQHPRPLIEISKTDDEKKFDMLRGAVEKLCEVYNTIIGDRLGDGNFITTARRMYPTGMDSIDKMENELNKLKTYQLEQYRQLVDRYVYGYSLLMQKVIKAVTSGGKNGNNGNHKG